MGRILGSRSAALFIGCGSSSGLAKRTLPTKSALIGPMSAGLSEASAILHCWCCFAWHRSYGFQWRNFWKPKTSNLTVPVCVGIIRSVLGVALGYQKFP